MKAEKLAIPEILLISHNLYGDDRGFFTEKYRESTFKDLGIKNHFVQENFSHSLPGVLRGLHYQYEPAQAKVVTCLSGKIFDVIVDVRKNSPTFGKSVQIILDSQNPQWVFMPAGFAHGFYVMGDMPADIFYKVDGYYNPKTEGCILWSDPDLKINWPVKTPLVSPKDQEGMTLKDYLKVAPF